MLPLVSLIRTDAFSVVQTGVLREDRTSKKTEEEKEKGRKSRGEKKEKKVSLWTMCNKQQPQV